MRCVSGVLSTFSSAICTGEGVLGAGSISVVFTILLDGAELSVRLVFGWGAGAEVGDAWGDGWEIAVV